MDTINFTGMTKKTINTGDLQPGDYVVGWGTVIASVTVTPSDMPAYQKQAIESAGDRVGAKVAVVWEDGGSWETSTHFETTVFRANALFKSAGHLCFSTDGTIEFFEVEGEVYSAHAWRGLFDANNTRRHGRWECSRVHFERFKSVIVG